jgi:pimeloyl-ACP methyl ester carboxylesterase
VPKGYHLLGHSLGAALGARFTGLVPQEVKSLTLLEGFSGRWPPEKEADRMQDWIKKLRRNKPTRESSMPSLGAVEELLAKAHPNTPPENRKKLAELWTNAKDNRYSWKHDPALRSRMLPVPFPPDLSRELWRRIQCPVLFVYGLRSELRPPDDQKSEILSHFGNLQEVALDSGHNPHQEIPEQLIQTLDKFYTEMPRMDQSVNQ